MPADAVKLWHSRAWGAAPFEPLAAELAELHDELVRRMEPQPGERWLDVATGTGPVALRAARAGAIVAALDIAPEMLVTASRLAAAEALRIRFDLGDAEALPYEAARFDVVSSAQGVMFAADHRAAASELSRVCRAGGRLGLTMLAAVPANAELFTLWERFGPAPTRAPTALAWGSESHVESLLGDAFELQFERFDVPLRGRSGQELWELQVRCCGPIKLLAQALPARPRLALRDAFVSYYERFRDGDGIRAPREFLVVTGRRRPRRP